MRALYVTQKCRKSQELYCHLPPSCVSGCGKGRPRARVLLTQGGVLIRTTRWLEPEYFPFLSLRARFRPRSTPFDKFYPTQQNPVL